jgi:transcriptional/translational regulatory protein YebC/TACO1
MTIQEWQTTIGIILGIAAIAGIVFGILRFYIKAFTKEQFDEIRHELKPNGGSSIKDQVTRLEEKQKEIAQRQHEDDVKFEQRIDKLENKIDDVFRIILDKLSK